jgi:uncharacterized membrane protein
MEYVRIERFFRIGRYLFAIAIVAFGIQNLIWAHHDHPVMTIIPWLPAVPFLTYLAGIAFLAAGICLALNLKARMTAILLGALFLVFEIFLQLPRAIVAPMDLGLRTLVFEILTMSGSALMLAGILPAHGQDLGLSKISDKFLIGLGRYFFAISAIVFSIPHFIVAGFIASLIPPWIPGPGLYWSYFTGAVFLVTGVSFLANWMARWAAAILGLMFLFWFLLLHLPRVSSYPRSQVPAEWSSAFIALGICGGCWIAVQAFSARPAHAPALDRS